MTTMTTSILRQFVKMGIIRDNTEITAIYKGIDLSGKAVLKVSGSFVTRKVTILKTGQAFINGVSIIDGHPERIEIENITQIDGMDIDRLLKVYSGSMDEED